MIQTLPTIKYTLWATENNEVYMPGAAHKTCTFNKTGASQQMTLFTNNQGFVRIYVRPSGPSDEIAHFQLQYTVGQTIYNQPVEFIIEARPLHRFPLSGVGEPPLSELLVRGALNEKQILELPDEALYEMGYPLRPDIHAAPGAYKIWLKAVTQPTKIVAPDTTENPSMKYRAAIPTTNGSRSGFLMEGPLKESTSNYVLVMGTIQVPTVSTANTDITFASAWVGLDNYQTDLVQAGIQFACVNVALETFTLTISAYNAWTEYLATQQTAIMIDNFNVGIGDEIFVQVWIGNAAVKHAGRPPTYPPPNLNGAYCIFHLENITNPHVVTIVTPRTLLVGGVCAEWIVERPLNVVTGEVSTPPNFTPFSISGACVQNTAGATLQYQAECNLQITMQDGAVTYANVAVVDSETMEFSYGAAG